MNPTELQNAHQAARRLHQLRSATISGPRDQDEIRALEGRLTPWLLANALPLISGFWVVQAEYRPLLAGLAPILARLMAESAGQAGAQIGGGIHAQDIEKTS